MLFCLSNLTTCQCTSVFTQIYYNFCNWNATSSLSVVRFVWGEINTQLNTQMLLEVISSWSYLHVVMCLVMLMYYCVSLFSHRWTSSSVRWQLRRSALRVSLHLQGEDLPLLYLWWTQWWTAVVFNLLWLWDWAEIFFLHREEWWADGTVAQL